MARCHDTIPSAPLRVNPVSAKLQDDHLPGGIPLKVGLGAPSKRGISKGDPLQNITVVRETLLGAETR